MDRDSSSYSADCTVHFLTSTKEFPDGFDMPAGIVYNISTRRDSRIYKVDIALMDAGRHIEIARSLAEIGVLSDNIPELEYRTPIWYLGDRYDFTLASWYDQSAEVGARVVCGTSNMNTPLACRQMANVGARCLALTTGGYYKLVPAGNNRVARVTYTSNRLDAVPQNTFMS